MEKLSDSADTDNKNQGFFRQVFNFDEDNKNSLLNLFQYSFISIPLVLIVLKVLNYYTPEEDDTKGALEIFAEILGSIVVLLFAIWFINKIVRYIPTYTKCDYKPFNEINFIIPLFVILLTIQTKLGSKINILVERLFDLIEGKTNLKDSSSKNKDYKTTQPISQAPTHQPSQADVAVMQQPQMLQNRGGLETQIANSMYNQNQNLNQIYQGPNNPLENANSPNQGYEPVAANSGGGGMFGSAF